MCTSTCRSPSLPSQIFKTTASAFVTPLIKMRTFQYSVLAALAAKQAFGHATFQQLWINSEDQISTLASILPWRR
jgi:hypothetical protein